MIKRVTKEKDKRVTDRQVAYDAISKTSDTATDMKARLDLIEEILGLKS